ncbi:MAG: chemotaxis protein CheB [Sphingobacteriales bacterium]|nr:MAG: chemotaxis protein CheB [Sphingobacteriales bacterium]
MANMQEPKFIVVVGASAGGLQSVIELVAQLRDEMNVSVFVVLHIPKLSLTEALVSRLQAMTTYLCKLGEDDEAIQARHVYLAPPDIHLLVSEEKKIVLGYGPAENRWRPSIDMLFRSAAAANNSRVIGIILSGLMQDGTAGMEAIRRSGGTLLVQDPAEAEYPDMPRSVLQNMEVDYKVSLTQMGAVLAEKTSNGGPPEHEVPYDIAMEARISQRLASDIETLREIGEQSPFSCPDCGGGLYYVNSKEVNHYRCHVGHSYTEGDLLFCMTKTLEGTLWTALRMMEERRLLLKRMAQEESEKGWTHSANLKKSREAEMASHIQRLKDLLYAAQEQRLDNEDRDNQKRAS